MRPANHSAGIAVLTAAALVLVGSCAGHPVRDPELPVARQVWPAPPEQPRIRYLRSLTVPEDLGLERGWFKRLRSALKGHSPRTIVSPYGVHRAIDGRLYVVDTFYGQVHVFDTVNSAYYRFPKKPIDGFVHPIGVTAGGDGRVYVSDSHAGVVHVFDDHGKRYVGTLGEGRLRRPTGLALREDRGELLVADAKASRIAVFDTTKLTLKTEIEGDGVDAFHSPVSVAVSGDGLIYVTDSLNFRVQVLGPDFGFRRTFGQAGDSPGSFSRPKGVAVDSDGHVYVVDALFDNVQVFDHEGRLLLAFGSPGQSGGQFWLPTDIHIDEENRIYVSDSYNERIQIFQYLKEPG